MTTFSTAKTTPSFTRIAMAVLGADIDYKILEVVDEDLPGVLDSLGGIFDL